MGNRRSDTLDDTQRDRLDQWSIGYDDGFDRSVRRIETSAAATHDEYVAGFAQGMKDRKSEEEELPPHG